MSSVFVFRYGRKIAEIDGDKKSVKEWIIKNVQPLHKYLDTIPETSTFEESVRIAQARGYSFGRGESSKISTTEVAKLAEVLQYAKFPEVAEELGGAENRGVYHIGKCPHCGAEQTLVIVPEGQMYRCFGCGASGNAINYVMASRGLTYYEAIAYLESKYINK